MAGLPDRNEGWRSRNGGRRERHEKEEALVGKFGWIPRVATTVLLLHGLCLGPVSEAVGSENGLETIGSRDFRSNPVQAARWLSDRCRRATRSARDTLSCWIRAQRIASCGQDLAKEQIVCCGGRCVSSISIRCDSKNWRRSPTLRSGRYEYSFANDAERSNYLR